MSSVCRMCLCSRSRGFRPMGERWGRSLPLASGRSLRTNLRPLAFRCRRTSSSSQSTSGTEDNDMSLVLLFALLLILSFAVLFHFLKPTAMEKAVARQLADIEERPNSSSDRTTILKDEAFRSNTFVDHVVGSMPWSPALTRLIKQSGQDWRATPVFLLSAAAAVGTGWVASLLTSNLVISMAIGAAVGASPYVTFY